MSIPRTPDRSRSEAPEIPRDHPVLRSLRGVARLVSRRAGIYGHAEWLRRWCARRGAIELRIDDFDDSLRFWCALDEHIGSNIFWRGAYSRDQLAFLAGHLTPEMVFLDVGANQGEFTVFAAKRLTRGQVIAAEPVPRLFARLTRNVEANGFTNTRLAKLGFGSKRRRTPIYTRAKAFTDGTNHSGLSTLYPDEARPEEIGTIEVVPLDDFARDLPMERLDVVKIDVEGAEREVLEGGSTTLRRHRPTLLVEVDEINCRRAGHTAAELVGQIVELGYELSHLRADGSLVPLEEGGLRPAQNLVCRPLR